MAYIFYKLSDVTHFTFRPTMVELIHLSPPAMQSTSIPMIYDSNKHMTSYFIVESAVNVINGCNLSFLMKLLSDAAIMTIMEPMRNSNGSKPVVLKRHVHGRPLLV